MFSKEKAKRRPSKTTTKPLNEIASSCAQMRLRISEMTRKWTEKNEMGGREIAENTQSHPAERRRGEPVQGPKGEEGKQKVDGDGRWEQVPVQDGRNIRSDVDIEPERILAKSQNKAEDTRDGEEQERKDRETY